jgi:hypothetical protein
LRLWEARNKIQWNKMKRNHQGTTLWMRTRVSALGEGLQTCLPQFLYSAVVYPKVSDVVIINNGRL